MAHEGPPRRRARAGSTGWGRWWRPSTAWAAWSTHRALMRYAS